MDKSTKVIKLAATSKNLKHNKANVSTVMYARLRQEGCVLPLMCCVQCTECFFTFFQALLKSIACDQFRVVPRLDGARTKKFGAPIFETRSFRSKCTVFKCTVYLRHCWDFSIPPVIRRPRDLPPLLPPWTSCL